MPPDKLTPDDPRVQHQHVVLNGISYHYLLAQPAGPPRATVFLVHGWPDFSFGWRYQVPMLVARGLRVVAPDMMGYNLSEAPAGLEYYTLKRAADDLAALAAHLACPRVWLLGHDWGGAVVYRVALWHPRLVAGVISVCTPFAPPATTYVPLEQLVQTGLPHFGYQLQFANGAVERAVDHLGPHGIRLILAALFGGRDASGRPAFAPDTGLDFAACATLLPPRLLGPAELDHYAAAFARHGLHGPLNWYRTRELNFRDERPLAAAAAADAEARRIRCPVLFIAAARDRALPPAMARGMERSFDDLTTAEVDAGHWALWQRPEECNALIAGFLERALEGGRSAGGGGASEAPEAQQQQRARTKL